MHLLLMLLAVLFSPPLLADDAAAWLKGMSQSLMTSNYRGVFVYQVNGRLEAMQIAHAQRPDGEHERLLSLTGSAREVIRSPEGVTCILPKRKAVMVDHNLPQSPVPTAFVDHLDKIVQHYRLSLLGTDRVAGRSCRVIAVSPRDQYRYGYRLWLTEQEHFPARLELMNPDGKVLEQMMFTDIKLVGDLPDAWLLPSLNGSQYEVIGQKTDEMTVVEGDVRWRADWLPAGFSRTHYNLHAASANERKVEHYVYSNGLATVSVYVENLAGQVAHFTGESSMGATNALGLTVGDHQLTVVGEVPLATIKRIAQSMRPTE